MFELAALTVVLALFTLAVLYLDSLRRTAESERDTLIQERDRALDRLDKVEHTLRIERHGFARERVLEQELHGKQLGVLHDQLARHIAEGSRIVKQVEEARLAERRALDALFAATQGVHINLAVEDEPFTGERTWALDEDSEAAISDRREQEEERARKEGATSSFIMED